MPKMRVLWVAVLWVIGSCAGSSAGDPGADAGADAVAATSTEMLLDEPAVALVGGRSAVLSVEVPADALGVLVSIRGAAGELYYVDEWIQPGDDVLVPSGWYATDTGAVCVSCANRVAAFLAGNGALAPNGPGVTLVAGTHHIRVGGAAVSDDAPSGATVGVSVWARRGATPLASGTLDLDLDLTGASGITAASAPADPVVQGWLDEARAILAPAGIMLGAVTFHDIDPVYAQIASVRDDMIEMIQAPTAATPDTPNVYLVGELPLMRGFSPVGGGLPVGGVQPTAVVLSLDHDKSPGFILAHELGHYLGLFHTQDTLGPHGIPTSDPYDDTADDDRDNLMHPDAQGTTLTPMQIDVLRRSPWLR